MNRGTCRIRDRSRVLLALASLGAAVFLIPAPGAEAKAPKRPSKAVKADLRQLDKLLDAEIARLDADGEVVAGDAEALIRKLRKIKDKELLRHFPTVGGVDFADLFYPVWLADKNLQNALNLLGVPGQTLDDAIRDQVKKSLERARKWLKELKERSGGGGAKLKPDGLGGEKMHVFDPQGRLEKLTDLVEKVIKKLEDGGGTIGAAARAIDALKTIKRAILDDEYKDLFGVELGTLMLRFEGMNDNLDQAKAVLKDSNGAEELRQRYRLRLKEVRSWKLALEDDLKVGCGFVPDDKAGSGLCGPPPLDPVPPAYSVLTVTVTGTGTGTGSVAPGPYGAVCSSTCSFTVPTGVVESLAASRDPGSAFAGWSGPCAGMGPGCSFTVIGHATATANFATLG